MAEEYSDVELDLTNGGLMASRHATALDAAPVDAGKKQRASKPAAVLASRPGGMRESRFAPESDSRVEPSQEEAPKKKKPRKHARKSTRDARKRELARFDAAREVDAPERIDEAAAALAGGEEAAAGLALGGGGEEAVVEEEEEEEAGGSLEDLAGDVPATTSSKGKQPMVSSHYHEDALRRLRDEQHAAAERFEDDIFKLQNKLRELTSTLSSKDTEISSLRSEVAGLTSDIEDPTRGYATQIEEASNAQQAAQQEIESLKKSITKADRAVKLADEGKTQLQNAIDNLQAQVKSKDADFQRLQEQNGELVAELQRPQENPELDAAQQELDARDEFDHRLSEQMDHILQDMVNTDDIFVKLDTLSKALTEARDARQAAEQSLQLETDRRNAQRASIKIGRVSSVSYEPTTLPRSTMTSTGSQTSKVLLSLSQLNSVDFQPFVPQISTISLGTQTDSVAALASTGVQTEASMSRYTTGATQTESTDTADTGTQTTAATTSTAGTQTVAAPTSTASTQTTAAITSTASTQTTAAITSTAGTQTLPSIMVSQASQTDPVLQTPITTVETKHSSLLDMRWLLAIIALLLAMWWRNLTIPIDRPEYWAMDEFRSGMYSRDLAQVGWGRWLGVDSSFIG